MRNDVSFSANLDYPAILITVNIAANAPGVLTNVATISGGGDSNPSNNQAVDTVILRTGTVVLAASPNPVVIGQPVTLTATLTAGSTGRVTFYDGAKALGFARVFAGQAVLTTTFQSSEMRFLRASFAPDTASVYGGSASAALPLSLSAQPVNGFQQITTYATPTSFYMALADFNRDGKADIVMAGGSTVSVLLGNGNGTFLPAKSSSVPVVAGALGVGDFNNDGFPDLVIGLKIVLGAGDGAFISPAIDYYPGVVPPGPVNVMVADFNRDGQLDVAVTSPLSRLVAIALGNGDGTFRGPVTTILSLPPIGNNSPPGAPPDMVTDDFNGDGIPDLAYGTVSGLNVLLGNGDGTFKAEENYAVAGGLGVNSLAVGDFNGDGKQDLAVNYFNQSLVTVMLGNGDGTFQPPGASYAGALQAVADLTGDGRSDLIVLLSGRTLELLPAKLDGTFGPAMTVAPAGPMVAGASVVVGDFNLDGSADLGLVNGSTQNLGVLLGGSFASPLRKNLAVWRPANGTWFINSNGTAFSQQWGFSGDIPVTADFDGDGLPDYVVWRGAEGNWYVLKSGDGTVATRQWGLPGDIPVAGDFDGDGKADFAVWRPSNGTWYNPAPLPGVPVAQQWGLTGDIPIVADFDGDGKADLAVWRPSNGTWYIQLSGARRFMGEQWGLAGDIPVAADFDGDGKADLAVWRPSNGTWYIIPSSNPGTPLIVKLGDPGDVPVPADYDNDGKVDLAIWRPSNGVWLISPSSTPNAPLILQWGFPTDVPRYKPAGN